MTPDERQRRFDEISAELAEIAEHKLSSDQVTERENELLAQLGRLDYEAGVDHFMAVMPTMDDLVPRGRGQQPRAAQIPFMITNAMREKLQALGHSEEAIDHMTPADAWKILEAANGG